VRPSLGEPCNTDATPTQQLSRWGASYCSGDLWALRGGDPALQCPGPGRTYVLVRTRRPAPIRVSDFDGASHRSGESAHHRDHFLDLVCPASEVGESPPVTPRVQCVRNRIGIAPQYIR